MFLEFRLGDGRVFPRFNNIVCIFSRVRHGFYLFNSNSDWLAAYLHLVRLVGQFLVLSRDKTLSLALDIICLILVGHMRGQSKGEGPNVSQ